MTTTTRESGVMNQASEALGVPGTADLADGGLESAARRQFMYGLGAVLVSGCGGSGWVLARPAVSLSSSKDAL
ncbi:hypothetical protein [Ralstonia pseudosolanacearum]|uniref:hypothetical protein n=1 Tax=Ralstonia pseudosolanacearum TaxID=1310165 RepID=UPI003D163A6C